MASSEASRELTQHCVGKGFGVRVRAAVLESFPRGVISERITEFVAQFQVAADHLNGQGAIIGDCDFIIGSVTVFASLLRGVETAESGYRDEEMRLAAIARL